MTTLLNVAQYITTRYEQLPSNKLYTLLYLCQEEYRKKFGENLFGSGSDTNALTELQIQHVDEVLQTYGGKSACELTSLAQMHHSPA